MPTLIKLPLNYLISVPVEEYIKKTLTLGGDTDETSVCRYDSEDKDYESMKNTFNTYDGTYHHKTIELPNFGPYVFYVRCQDSWGNKNSESVLISFKYKDPEAEEGQTEGDDNITEENNETSDNEGEKNISDEESNENSNNEKENQENEENNTKEKVITAEKDDKCEKEENNICDPDCKSGEDPDCAKVSAKSGLSNWPIFLIVPAILVVVIVLVFVIKKIKGGKGGKIFVPNSLHCG